MKRHEKITNTIVHKLYSNVEPFANQRKGCSADYIINGNYCLEVKYDQRAFSTGNIFIEYATEFNQEFTTSGISLSALHDYQVLYLVPEISKIKAYEIPAMDLLALGVEFGKKVRTGARVNGNRENFYGLGYKLSIDYIKEFYIGEVDII